MERLAKQNHDSIAETLRAPLFTRNKENNARFTKVEAKIEGYTNMLGAMQTRIDTFLNSDKLQHGVDSAKFRQVLGGIHFQRFVAYGDAATKPKGSVVPKDAVPDKKNTEAKTVAQTVGTQALTPTTDTGALQQGLAIQSSHQLELQRFQHRASHILQDAATGCISLQKACSAFSPVST